MRVIYVRQKRVYCLSFHFSLLQFEKNWSPKRLRFWGVVVLPGKPQTIIWFQISKVCRRALISLACCRYRQQKLISSKKFVFNSKSCLTSNEWDITTMAYKLLQEVLQEVYMYVLVLVWVCNSEVQRVFCGVSSVIEEGSWWWMHHYQRRLLAANAKDVKLSQLPIKNDSQFDAFNNCANFETLITSHSLTSASAFTKSNMTRLSKRV